MSEDLTTILNLDSTGLETFSFSIWPNDKGKLK